MVGCEGIWLIDEGAYGCCSGYCVSEREAEVPYSFFFVHAECTEVHGKCLMELEEGEKGLIYDRGAWLELNKLVDLADQYNVPLTIMFWPTAVDVILDDPKKIEAVKSWQAAGHEIGIHIQYDGQGNFNPDNLSRYRKLLDFSYQTEIKSGTIVNKDMNTPQETIYDVDGRVVGDALGGDPHQDGRTSKAIVNSFNNHLTYRINARAGYLDPRTKELEYNSLEPDEIYGVGLHPVDILQDPKIIENWFKFLHDKDPQGIKRMTVSGLMESYVILNNLIIGERCGNTVWDGEERTTGSCEEDHNDCEKENYGLGEYAGRCDRGFADEIYLLGKKISEEKKYPTIS